VPHSQHIKNDVKPSFQIGWFHIRLQTYSRLAHNHIWIKKATGLGIIEFFLGYTALMPSNIAITPGYLNGRPEAR